MSARTVFVDIDNRKIAQDLGQIREEESQHSLAVLGVEHHRQQYSRLPDTKLVNYTGALALSIASHAIENDLYDYYTLGEYGYDGHPDHQATHQAARLAAAILRLTQSRPLQLWSLTADIDHAHTTIPTTTTPKLAALSRHETQMPLRHDTQGSIHITDGTYWEQFVDQYGTLLYENEHYLSG
ncbi:hypothetical protein CR970_00355 [Candidatus Saccharibacteria bacterium]|nr:MAG: hypothetical protein CR970_00355 [Candidatus Saccharibacteria bacterium]